MKAAIELTPARDALISIPSFEIETRDGKISIYMDVLNKQSGSNGAWITPDQARAIAANLTVAADMCERSGTGCPAICPKTNL
jgi:hypothetical protein